MKDAVAFAHGDINQDGIGDLVAIIHNVEGDAETESIIVLRGLSGGRYSLMSESASWEPHWRRNEFMTIKDNSIYVGRSSGTYTEYDGTVYQFKLHSDQLSLVGLEYESGVIGGKATNRISANFLTNKVIEWREASYKPKVTHRILRGKYMIRLEQFALDEAVDASSLK